MTFTVYTGGTFDLFHAGHVDLLRQCHQLAAGGRVVVSLNTDSFVDAYKGAPPVVCYEDRKKVLLSCRYVDDVVENTGGADSKPAIEAARPDVIAIGADWAPPRDYHAQMGFSPEWLDERDILLVYIHRSAGGSSSTGIKKQVLLRDSLVPAGR